MMAHNLLCPEEVFSNLYEEISFEKCCARSVSSGKPTSMNINVANLEIYLRGIFVDTPDGEAKQGLSTKLLLVHSKRDNRRGK